MNHENGEIMGEEIENLTSGQRLLNIFYSPGKVFKSINHKPNFWLPMIITMVISLLFYLAYSGPFGEIMMTTLEAQAATNPAMTPEFIETLVKIFSIAAIIIAPFSVAFMIFLSALFYWLGSMIFKGHGSYMKYVSIMAHVGLISTISLIVTGLMYLISGEFLLDRPITSLASLLPDSMKMTMLDGLLLNFEVFSIWRLILIAIGIQEISGLSRKKAFVIVGIIYSIGIILTCGSLLLSTVSYN